ncbi:MAG: histidinol-phosphatase HisJ family protein [Schwartzia sp.]|nr:histidinol-phosphatase HisJ family protein [Schwartzia sp. (in: firmicutes)]MBR1886212.1 histidinol-phosphatase HisJ family protein [Schwartzia sp. (in: firmicutes)]
MLFDSHVHTEFSADSEMKARDALAAAEALGIGLVFTEHIDFSYQGKLNFVFSPEAYWKAYEPLRGDRLFLGVELGMVPGELDMAKAFLARAPFDEVVGSIHLIDGGDIYEPSTYEGKTQEEVYLRYFALMRDMVRQNPYIDTLAHIDYIARYAPYERPGISCEVWHDAIDEVLRAVIETDTALEINTRRFGDRLAMKELAPIYRRYAELGGRDVTLGSDAHRKAAVGAHLDLAAQMAGAYGLEVVAFRGRKRVKVA